MTFPFFPGHQTLLKKVSTLKRKSKFFPFRADNFSEGNRIQNHFDSVASLESVHFPFKWSLWEINTLSGKDYFVKIVLFPF